MQVFKGNQDITVPDFISFKITGSVILASALSYPELKNVKKCEQPLKIGTYSKVEYLGIILTFQSWLIQSAYSLTLIKVLRKLSWLVLHSNKIEFHHSRTG